MLEPLKDKAIESYFAFAREVSDGRKSSNDTNNVSIIKILGLYRKIFFRQKMSDISLTRELSGADGISVTQGLHKNSLYNLVEIDLNKNKLEPWVAPRDEKTGKFKINSLDKIADIYKPHLVLNGIFYNAGNDNQPLGVLVYNEGKSSWTPTVKTFDGIPVVKLNRYYFGIDKEGKPKIGKTEGRDADSFIKEGYGALIGGGGPLALDGKVIVSEETLKEARFHYSTHQMDKPRQRTAVGIDNSGKVMMVTFGHQYDVASGIALKELAEFMVDEGAQSAIFLDSGSSCGMYISDDGCDQTGIPKPQPTFLLVKSKKDSKG